MRLLFLMRDALPPFRADVQVLFGKCLLKHSVFSDLVGQYTIKPSTPLTWPAGDIYIAGAFQKGLLAELIRPLKDLKTVLCLTNKAYDLIQVRDKIRIALGALAFARCHKIPFVYWMSFPFVEGYQITAQNRHNPSLAVKLADQLRCATAHWLFYRWVLPSADHIFVQSEAMLEWLVNKGVAANRMTAVPMGVNTEQFQRGNIVPIEDPRLNNKRVLIYVGQISKARQSDFMLDLLLALKARAPKTMLVLAGDAPSPEEQQWLRDAITQRDLDNDVILTGWLSQDEIMRYVVKAEVGLSPIPRGELFDVSSPTKLVEYLALGLPSVANDIPDQKLVIDVSQAGLCVPMEINAFRDAILKLLNDAEFYQHCVENGPVYIHNTRAYDVIAEKVALTYQTILKNHAQ